MQIREGARVDASLELVSRCTIECANETVRRLLVETDAGDRVAIVVAPSHGSPPPADQPGARYDLRGGLGCTRRPTPDTHGQCPDCGGRLREGTVLDTCSDAVVATVERLDVEPPFVVADGETTLSPATPSDRDDWRPAPWDTDQAVTPPETVCVACGTHHDRRETGAEAPRHQADHAASAPPADTVGLAAGGAKDASNFRENIREGFTPQPEALSEEGLFYDYHFETGERAENADVDSLFAPRYATAVSEHPLDGTTERYVSVGLDSTLSMAEFERPRLDLVAVLDVSGSMDSPFDEYYYDEHGRRREVDDSERTSETKLAAATESLCELTRQLRDDDRLGVVLYNNRSHVAKPLRDVGSTDMDAIRHHVQEVAASGGTNMADGFEAAAELLADGSRDPRVERRVVFMTDAMPNVGATDESELTDLFADAAAEGIHTTFVGMGLDANADLVDQLSAIRGANHYFVHSAAEFERRLGEEFDYMVTPLVYDLQLTLETEGYELAAVHGSPVDAADDRLLDVGTLFPSSKDDGDARGGIVLARVERTAAESSLELVASWTERGGREHTERVTVEFPDEAGYEHDGIRKAVALARYARELQSWAETVHDRADRSAGVDDWLLPDDRERHERESVPLAVSNEHARRFDELHAYLESEIAALGDDTLDRELTLLDRLRSTAQQSVEEPAEVSE